MSKASKASKAERGNTRTCGDLHDYTTGEYLRAATAAEQSASREAAEHDGGAGVIKVDGRSCYVQD